MQTIYCSLDSWEKNGRRRVEVHADEAPAEGDQVQILGADVIFEVVGLGETWTESRNRWRYAYVTPTNRPADLPRPIVCVGALATVV